MGREWLDLVGFLLLFRQVSHFRHVWMTGRESTAAAFDVINIQDQGDDQGEEHETGDTDAYN